MFSVLTPKVSSVSTYSRSFTNVFAMSVADFKRVLAVGVGGSRMGARCLF